MSNIAAFHPDWLITLWFTTPVLRALNPHITLSVIVVITVIVVFLRYFRERGKKRMVPGTISREDEQFRHLLQRRRIVERKLAELEDLLESGELAIEQYESKVNDYKRHLERVNRELLYFT